MKIYMAKIILVGYLIAGSVPGNCFAQQIQQMKLPEQGVQPMPPAQAGAEKISLDIKGMDISDVLKMLSIKSGKNIVAGKNVRGKVTIFLKDVDVMDALEMILISNELAYDMKGDIINVMTDRDYELLYGERFKDTKKLKVVKLKYVKAEEMSKALIQIKSKIGKLVVDNASNSIVIMDAPQTVSQMEELIKAMDLPTVTRVFELNYSKAETMKAKLEPFLTKGVGTIQIDERTNKIIITDLENNMKAVESAVAEFDAKTKQVLIEAKILQITLNDEYKAGINWDAIFNGIKTQLGMNFSVIDGTPIPTTAVTPKPPTAGGVHVGGLNTSWNFEAMVKFLQTIGKTNLLASPRIIATNNEEAKILVGTNQPYATSQTTTTTGAPTTTAYQITFLDLGVKLYVTPTINNAGFITMKIKPEVSSTSESLKYGSNDDQVPIVKTSQAETTVMVKDGTTIVIAGLIENREEEKIEKVPGLGDAPLIGPVFRNRTTGSTTNPEKNELVIFLTPHIISGEADSEDVEKYSLLTGKLENQLIQKEMKDVARKMNKELAGNEGVSKVPVVTDLLEGKVLKGDTDQPQKQVTLQDYYETVRNRILDKIKDNAPSGPVKGEVSVSFCVAKDGSLKGMPALLKPVDPALRDLVIKSVNSAAPFPAFPENFTAVEETFRIDVVYE